VPGVATWLASAECKLEFRYDGNDCRKQLFLAIIKPCDPQDLRRLAVVPVYGEGTQTTLRFEFREQPAACAFLSSGLERLKYGLEKAGISASTSPGRPPTIPTGTVPRTEAAGRGRCGGVLRAQRANPAWHGNHGRHAQDGIERLLVILGASGSGKSSFMRAGLLPRLARDDRQFFPLPVIRPRNAVLVRADGLAPALAAPSPGWAVTSRWERSNRGSTRAGSRRRPAGDTGTAAAGPNRGRSGAAARRASSSSSIRPRSSSIPTAPPRPRRS